MGAPCDLQLFFCFASAALCSHDTTERSTMPAKWAASAEWLCGGIKKLKHYPLDPYAQLYPLFANIHYPINSYLIVFIGFYTFIAVAIHVCVRAFVRHTQFPAIKYICCLRSLCPGRASSSGSLLVPRRHTFFSNKVRLFQIARRFGSALFPTVSR